MLEGATPLRTVGNGPRTGLTMVLIVVALLLMAGPFLLVFLAAT